jgi:hypothetical protein
MTMTSPPEKQLPGHIPQIRHIQVFQRNAGCFSDAVPAFYQNGTAFSKNRTAAGTVKAE